MLWTPPAEDIDQIVTRLVDDLVKTYSKAEQDLIKALANEVKAGLDQEGKRDTSLRLQQLRASAEQSAEWLHSVTPEMVEHLVYEAAMLGGASALQQLAAMPGWDAPTREVPTAPAVNNLIGELTSAFDDVQRRILRLPDDLYRTVIAEETAQSLLLGSLPHARQQSAWVRMLSQGVTGFTDKAGRNWNLATYTEMASRTATIRAYRSQHTETHLQNGVEWVTIIGGNDACSKCGPWMNKVLAIQSGAQTGTVQARSAIADEAVSFHVDGTLGDAIEAGLEHPNCRCQRVAFTPGLEPETGAKYDPDLEDDRDRLRALERKVRKLKREQLVDDTSEVQRKIREAQKKIRDHVKDTGIQRQRRREQLNLSNKR